MNRAPLVEKVAASIDPELLDLVPVLANGTGGLRGDLAQLRFLLQLNGGDSDDQSDLLAEIGVDKAQCLSHGDRRVAVPLV